MTVPAVYALELQLSGSAGAWTNVWPDVRFDSPFRGQYGIRGAGPTDRVAGVGTLSFALNNAADNSAGLRGYYSPGHGNARAGFDLGIGVRFAVRYPTDATGVENASNIGFELGGASTFTNWTTYTNNGFFGGASTVGTGGNVRTGARSVGLLGDNNDTAYIQQTVTVTSLTPYILSFYSKGTGTETGRYSIYDASNNADIVAITSAANTTTSFVLRTVTFTTPAGCTSVRLRLLASDSFSPANFVYFDDVSLIGPTTYYKFRGTLDEILPVPGVRGRQLTLCSAVDWMDETRREKTRLIATQLDKRGNELIDTMVANMTRKPAASSLATGQDIFPFAFDNSPDEHTSVMQMLQLIAQSELGFVYLAGDTATGGVLTFQDRHARPKAGSAVASLNNTMVSMTPRRSRDTIYNHVKATVHPRRTDSSACVLFTLRNVPRVPVGKPLVFMSAYLDRTAASNPLQSRIGAFTACNLVQSTDYLFNTASNGGGADLSASLVVGASFGANSHRISLTNNAGVDGYVTRLQIRGRGLYDYEPVELEAIDAVSTGCFGDNVLTYDMKLQNETDVGRDVADYLLAVWKDPLTRLETVGFIANTSDALMLAAVQSEPSTRINLVEPVSGLDRDFYINGIGFELADKNVLKFEWLVVATDPFAAWIIGVGGSSEIGVTTIVGY